MRRFSSITFNSFLKIHPSHLFYFSNWRQNCDEWQPIVTFTQLRQNPLYITYYTTLTRLLLLGIFPLSLLMFFNYRIHYELQIPSIIEALPEIERIARRHQEKELAKVLIGIVSLFIVCHTLKDVDKEEHCDIDTGGPVVRRIRYRFSLYTAIETFNYENCFTFLN